MTAFSGDICKLCDSRDGVVCYKNSSLPKLTGGLYRSPADTDVILSCYLKETCLETNSTSLETPCAEGYTGFLCESCIPQKLYKQGLNCSACPTVGAQILTLSVFIILVLLIIWAVVSKGFSLSGEFKMLVFWIQIIATYPETSSNWPSELKNFFQILKISNLDIEITSPECSISLDFWVKYRIKLFVPLFQIFMLLTFASVHRIKLKTTIDKRFVFYRLQYFFTTVTCTMYTSIILSLLSPFLCNG